MNHQTALKTQKQTTTPATSDIQQRPAIRSVPEKSMSPLVLDVLNLSGKPPNSNNRACSGSDFVHDFSWVQVQNIVPSERIQTKLIVGKPDDKYEQEADKVADQIIRMSTQSLQLKPT